jgi:Uma2 family endonuclease
MAVAVAEAEVLPDFQTGGNVAALDPEREYELVNGQWEAKEMAGARHGGVMMRLCIRLGNYIEANDLGGIYGPDTTFTIGAQPRLPDVAIVFAERIPSEGEPEGQWEIAPDLAVEVISPNDVYNKVGTTGISMGEIANSNWFLRAAGFQTHSLPSLCFL